MPEYQVIARKFRPQSFKEVIGQEAIVTTLKNAIRFKRLAQAYLFCGSRGTGKTTLARIFAKALNCQQLTPDFEPCNQCSACREITNGHSLDVLEIDGASNRGIEDIRQINENVGYAAASGNYKIYIIDEVHMLTKEAFNALLKTLEEPPPKVKFFFATTEPHKVLPTILSRCQRFNLSRIPAHKIQSKLRQIVEEMQVEADEEALCLLAQQAEGGLRDAESLLDQILAFEENKMTIASVQAILGLTSKEIYFEMDRAGKEGKFAVAFEISHRIFSEGKDLMHFVEGLIEHFRTLLLIQLSGRNNPLLNLSESEKQHYETSAKLYTQEQCMTLIDYLIEAQNHLRFSSNKIAIEAILLHIMRSHFRIPIEFLVRRLSELEKAINENNLVAKVPSQLIESQPGIVNSPKPTPIVATAPPMMKVDKSLTAIVTSAEAKAPLKPIPSSSVSEDPTPSPSDLGLRKETPAAVIPKVKAAAPIATNTAPTPSLVLNKPSHHYDTLLQFAAIELEGKVQKMRF